MHGSGRSGTQSFFTNILIFSLFYRLRVQMRILECLARQTFLRRCVSFIIFRQV
jgi:hypothetical protein